MGKKFGEKSEFEFKNGFVAIKYFNRGKPYRKVS